MKLCPDCGETKALDQFPVASKRSDGRGTYCKACMRGRSRASYRKRSAEAGRTVREREVLPDGVLRCLDCQVVQPLDAFPCNKNTKSGRHPYCKPCHNTRGKESKDRLYGGSGHYHRRYRYGMEDGLYDELLYEQDGVCAICLELPAEHVDHDHATGEIRGLLCFNCNGGLGQFKDRVDILLAAIQYLDRSRGQTWDTTSAWVPSPRPSPQQGPAASATS